MTPNTASRVRRPQSQVLVHPQRVQQGAAARRRIEQSGDDEYDAGDGQRHHDDRQQEEDDEPAGEPARLDLAAEEIHRGSPATRGLAEADLGNLTHRGRLDLQQRRSLEAEHAGNDAARKVSRTLL